MQVRAGDRLVVHVYNGLDEGLSFHWHGLSMRGALLSLADALQLKPLTMLQGTMIWTASLE